MSRPVRRSAIHRAAEELQAEHPDSRIENGVASFMGDSIAMDFGARIIYCRELGVFEIIDQFTPKQEIVAKVRRLMGRVEERRSTETAEKQKLF